MDETETVREQVKSSLPQWRSHKIVRAAQIRAIYPADHEAGWMVYLDGGDPPWPAIYVKPEIFSRYTPQSGDYFVVYDDGYESVSPRKSFEEGYGLYYGEAAIGQQAGRMPPPNPEMNALELAKAASAAGPEGKY